MRNRSLMLMLSITFALGCDSQTDAGELTLDEEPVLAYTPVDGADADVPLGVDLDPQFDTKPCKSWTKNTESDTFVASCKPTPGPFLPPNLGDILQEVGWKMGVADCAVSGNAEQGNGQTRCANVCSTHSMTWAPAGDEDLGICLVDEEITMTGVALNPAPMQCANGKITASVHTEAQCGCSCTP